MKFNIARLDSKITLVTLKALIAAAGSSLHVKTQSRFDGMTDCVQSVKDDFSPKVACREDSYTLGVGGVYLVGGSRNSFSKFEDEGFIGIRCYNCCGSWVVALRKEAAQPVQSPAPVENPETGITVTVNEELNGVEIRFASCPPETTREALKAAGWRWSRFAKCWWAKRTESALGFASLFTRTA